MAWGSSDEGKFSEFNPAALKMMRLDKAQTLINQINGNLLAYNSEHGVYNFELKFRVCNNLYQEVESKLSKDERKDAEEMRKAVEKALENNQIYTSSQNKTFPYNKTTKLNEGTWKIIKKWLFDWETRVRALLDSHGLDTKYIDDSGL